MADGPIFSAKSASKPSKPVARESRRDVWIRRPVPHVLTNNETGRAYPSSSPMAQTLSNRPRETVPATERGGGAPAEPTEASTPQGVMNMKTG